MFQLPERKQLAEAKPPLRYQSQTAQTQATTLFKQVRAQPGQRSIKSSTARETPQDC